ncbi:MAG: hypothetical protein WC455_10160 [Dehalococcoidia bacterium]|jgi:hypothetical protein
MSISSTVRDFKATVRETPSRMGDAVRGLKKDLKASSESRKGLTKANMVADGRDKEKFDASAKAEGNLKDAYSSGETLADRVNMAHTTSDRGRKSLEREQKKSRFGAALAGRYNVGQARRKVK